MQADSQNDPLVRRLLVTATTAYAILAACGTGSATSEEFALGLDRFGTLLGVTGAVAALALSGLFLLALLDTVRDPSLSPSVRRNKIALLLIFNLLAGYVYWMRSSRTRKSVKASR